MAGGVVDHAIDLARFDPGTPPALVLPPWPGLDRAAARAASAGIRVLRLAPAPRRGGVAEWLAGRPVDLVHVHYATAEDATPAVEVALAHGIAVVSTDHACPVDAVPGVWEARRRAAGRQAALLADSNAIAEGLASRLGRAVEVVPHGIDVAHFQALPGAEAARRKLRLPEQAQIVASAGALFSHKGMHRLLRAMVELSPQPLLLIAGEGPERPRLEAEARAAGVRLCMPGWLGDVRVVLAAAHVFALASDSEGLPSVVLQAMAAGIPVVAVDSGGVREALGPHGFLVPPGDQAALVAALRRALSGELAPELGAARARGAQHFEARVMAARVSALHAAILEGDRLPAEVAPGSPD